MICQIETAQPLQMWRMVWRLLHLRVLILTRSFRRANSRQKFGMVLLTISLIALLGFIFFLSLNFLRFLGSPLLIELGVNPDQIMESIPALVLSGAFIGILFTSFGVLLQALYLAGDMDFLLSTPIPMRAVFTAKLLQAILPNFGLVCLFALPLLFGIGASSGYTVLYYPTVVVILSALAIAAAGIASLLVMGVVRIFPARRVAEILGLLGGVISILCAQSGQIANWAQLSTGQTQRIFQLVSWFNAPWSPLAWASWGIRWIGEARWLVGLGVCSAVLMLSGLVFLGALITAEKLYYNGWASLQIKQRKPKTSRSTNNKIQVLTRLNYFPLRAVSAVIQIVLKDFMMLRRDVRNMSQLITPLIVGIVYFVMLLRGGSDLMEGAGSAPAWTGDVFRSIQAYSSVGLALFVGWMLLSRLAGMGFSHEGKHYWLLKTAPISSTQLIISKYLVAFIPVVGLCCLFFVITTFIQKHDARILLFALPVIALTVAGNTGIYLSFGILGANMNWEDPRQMQRGVSGCLGSLVSMFYLAISLGLFFLPSMIGTVIGMPVGLGQVVGIIIGSIFCIACAVIPLWGVRKRVELLGEG